MPYNLRNLGATLPSSLMVVEELTADFKIDPSAPKYSGTTGEGMNRLYDEEATKLLDNCRLIGASVSDNDQEIWFLSQAGEVFRATGEGSARFFQVEESEFEDYLESYADDTALEALSQLGIYKSNQALNP